MESEANHRPYLIVLLGGSGDSSVSSSAWYGVSIHHAPVAVAVTIILTYLLRIRHGA